jgi:molybdopterin/thiamine biosynthesis adenylyltransferase
MLPRYSKNGILSDVEMHRVTQSKVCIIGCGGLGGYVLEMLARLGVGHITVVDCDLFDESNLNRQILSSHSSLALSKVEIAMKRMADVNPLVKVYGIHDQMTSDNVHNLIRNHDVVVDALDSIDSRLVLESACEDEKIPMVHGAIAGWYGQVATIAPGDRILFNFYRAKGSKGIEAGMGNPSFTPATIASIQVSEVLKVLVRKDQVLKKQMLFIDLLDNEFHVIEI